MKRLNTQSLRRRLLLGAAPIAALAASAAFAMTATAQDGDAAGGADQDVIVVTGFRSSLNAALNVKRNESGVVDSILAQDIADFPDLNLAESLQRIPGVAIDRVSGEGRQITVRGLPSTFNRIRINGMESTNATGSTDSSGGSNRGRGFDFNTFASDLFNEITVRKTSSGSVDEGSLGATVDLRTARPFDYDDGFTFVASGQAGYNDLSEEWSPRGSVLLSTTNTEGTFGALLSVAYSDRSILEEGFSTVRFQDGNFNSVNGVDCVVNPADAGCASVDTNSLTYHPRIPRYGRLTHEQQRLGVSGSLQFRPTPQTEISLDGLFSRFEATREEEFLEVFFRSQEQLIDVTSFTVDPALNIIDSGVFDIAAVGNGTHPIRSEHRFDELNTDFTQITLNVDHEFSDRLHGNFLVGSVESNFELPVSTTIFYDAVGTVSGYSYDLRGNPDTPLINFGSLDVTNPAQFAFTEFRDRPQTVDNTFDTVAGSLEFDMSDAVTIRGGLSWKEFGFATTELRRESTFGSRICDAGLFDCDLDNDGTDDIAGAPITGDLLNALTGYGSGLGAPAGNPTSWVSPNVQAAAALIGIYDIPGAVRPGNVRSVTEEDTGVWAQLDFETMLGSIPVRGDVGIRYVETKVTSTGLVTDGGSGFVNLTVEDDYTDTLPSANIVFEVHEDFLVRFAASKVMTRPGLGDLTPGGSLDSFNYEFDQGNPGLAPFRANAFDASFEWYFAEESLLSLGLFYKDIGSFFTQGGSTMVPYSALGLPIGASPASTPLRIDLDNGLDPTIEVSQVQNGGSATLQGFELVYQQPFTFLPAPFDRFGFQGNFTHVESDEINGFSPNAYNATLYYEDDRLSARISAAQRDAYRTRPPGDNGRDERGYDGTLNIDFASSYSVNDNLEFTFEAINLTDEFEKQLFDSGDLTYVYHHTGTEFLFGVRWRN